MRESGGVGVRVRARARAIPLLLVAAMTLGMMPQLSMSAFADAGSNTDAIILVEDGKAPVIKDGQGGTSEGGVYFGNYKQDRKDENGQWLKDPVKWRVLENAEGKLFLLTDKLMDQGWLTDGYDHSTYPSTLLNVFKWENSQARMIMNTNSASEGVPFPIIHTFSSKEQSAILLTEVFTKGNEERAVDAQNVVEDVTTLDKLFYLSVEDVKNPAYGFSSEDNGGRVAEPTAYAESEVGTNAIPKGAWSLRSNGESNKTFLRVMSNGTFKSWGGNWGGFYCRPACNLNLSTVLFISDAEENGKEDVTGPILIPAGSNTSGTWKFTLKDDGSESAVGDGHAEFAIGQATYDDRKMLNIPYSGAAFGDNEYVSALVKDKNGKVTCYSRLKKCVSIDDASGTVEVDTANVGEEDTLYLFNEQYNGDRRTSYASALKKVVTPAKEETTPEEKTPEVKNTDKNLTEKQFAEEEEVIPVQVPGSILLARMTAKGKTRMNISWTKQRGAAGYDVYFARCNHHDKTITCKKIKTVKGNKTFKWTKKGLRKGVAYKAYVKAFVMKNGKKSYIATSPMVHALAANGTRGLTNPRKVTVKKAKATMKVGKTFTIKAKVKKVRKGRKLLNDNHAAKLRYLSSDKRVATVSKAGKITAKAKGRCKVYAYAVNGARKAVTVTVK